MVLSDPHILTAAIEDISMEGKGGKTKMNQQEKLVLNYPLFDGDKVIESASVVVENGTIMSINKNVSTDNDCLLMPGLIDAHTHLGTKEQVWTMLQSGVIAACDVAAPDSLIKSMEPFTIISSAGMTMGTLSGKSYVNNAIKNGAKYIKVLLMEPNLMLKGVLKDICNTAHRNGLKVAIHAISIKSVRMAVDCGADILLHVPMKETFPKELADTIAKKGIVVVPTLIMMEAFATSERNGYRPDHYFNAEDAVKLLHKCGVTILAGTDANPGSFAPAVAYGTSIHREMELLAKAGLTPVEVLASATDKTAEVFGITDIGTIKTGKRAVLMLVKGRPDKEITDTINIKQVWIDGNPILG